MSDKAKGKMTVFKTDRHEDVAAMVFVSLVVVFILVYMAYVVPTITITPAPGRQARVPQGAARPGDKERRPASTP